VVEIVRRQTDIRPLGFKLQVRQAWRVKFKNQASRFPRRLALVVLISGLRRTDTVVAMRVVRDLPVAEGINAGGESVTAF
jgi:hypothetical protein